MKTRTKKIFSEVLWDYTEEGTGNIAIDAYKSRKADAEGVTVCWVTPDGEVLAGENSDYFSDIKCARVQEAIQLAKNEQAERKEKVADDVLEQVKADAVHGDYEVLYELLAKFVPIKNLIQALPEEKWKDYPIEIK